MPDVLEAASSGRSKCRSCGGKIAQGELRFGEELPNPFAEGTSLFWFHLQCAACLRPEKFQAALTAFPGEVPERSWLERTAALGATHRRLPRLAGAERAKSARATCRSCRERIDGGAWRLALHMFEEGRANPSGYIHVECALNYFGTAEIADRIERLSAELSRADLAEIERALATPHPPLPEGDAPPLAKTQGSEPEAKALAKTGRKALNGAKPAAK